MLKRYAFVLMLLGAGIAQAADIEANRVTLRGVDKITGRISTMELAVGETVQFGKLNIVVNKCLIKPIEEAPENKAFLTITKQGKEALEPVFNGWMFSSNPALSAMEDSVYDVWVIGCMQTDEPVENPVQLVEPAVNAPDVVMENLPDNSVVSDVVEEPLPVLQEVNIENIQIEELE